MAKAKFASRAFLIAAMLFLVSAAMPVFRGQPSNNAFLAVGIVLFITGAGLARKGRR